jgi:CO/xanthine dehydrogenase FAD-binding subunit
LAIEGVAKAFEFSEDAFASSEYRSAAATQLTARLLAEMTA